MAMPIDVTTTEALTWTGSGGLALVILRYAYKIVRRDFEEVKDSDQKESVLGHYKDLADRYRLEADENAKRADQFAEERNRAVEELGKLRGEVVKLTGQVEHLENQIKHLSKTIDLLNRLCTVPNAMAPHLAVAQTGVEE